MTKKSHVRIAAVLSLAMLGLAMPLQTTSAAERAPVVLIGTWQATEIAGTPVSGANKPELTIEDDRTVFGSSGCNRVMGNLEGDREKVSFSPLATTKKLCPEDIMKLEQGFLDALGAAKAYVANKVSLELMDDHGKVLAKMTRQ